MFTDRQTEEQTVHCSSILRFL